MKNMYATIEWQDRGAHWTVGAPYGRAYRVQNARTPLLVSTGKSRIGYLTGPAPCGTYKGLPLVRY